ncbi:MAG: F0F1 ATP synthase subunit delta [Microlunatus sp.]
MAAPQDVRLSVLDPLLDEAELSDQLAHELFSVVDALDGSPTLRRVATDPSTPETARAAFVSGLLTGKVSDACVALVAAATRRRWSSGSTFAAALERQAVRAQLLLAERAGHLDETEDELFRFARLVESDGSLRNALSERSVDKAFREGLVGDLLDGKATLATVVLAKRAVGARNRSYGHTLESYINLAAALRDRVIATVRVARPLTDEQLQRLRAGLSRQVGRNVGLQVIVEPDLLGGVRVELGTEVIEGTVSGRLAEARKLFV